MASLTGAFGAAAAKAAAFGGMVKVEHTLFALPFAYAGAFLAAGGVPAAHDLIWITLAMAGARSAAMGMNRIIDRRIDAKNPRTQGRHLPAGRLLVRDAWAFTLLSLGLLGVSAWQLNPLCVAFLPLVVPALVVYPYTKRFTWTCHYWLGAAQFFAPFGGWIAVTGEIHPAPVFLGLAVGLWIAGFDIFYALQDLEFDRREEIRSVPACLGVPAALRLALATHLVTFGLFIWVGRLLGLGGPYWAALAVAAGLVAYQHWLVRPGVATRGLKAFNVNMVVGPLLFLGILVDVLA